MASLQEATLWSQPWALGLAMLASYLLGAVPCGYLLGRLRGVDLRSLGSGNIGASNATRGLGAKLGLLVFVADVLKAALAPWLLSVLAPELDLWWIAGAGVSAFLGHIYPIYLKFRGGKGVSCALGVCFVLILPAGIAALLLYVQTLWLTRVSAIGSLTSVSMMSLFVLLGDHPAPTRVAIVTMSLIIWWRHKSNLQSILSASKAG